MVSKMVQIHQEEQPKNVVVGTYYHWFSSNPALFLVSVDNLFSSFFSAKNHFRHM